MRLANNCCRFTSNVFSPQNNSTIASVSEEAFFEEPIRGTSLKNSFPKSSRHHQKSTRGSKSHRDPLHDVKEARKFFRRAKKHMNPLEDTHVVSFHSLLFCLTTWSVCSAEMEQETSSAGFEKGA